MSYFLHLGSVQTRSRFGSQGLGEVVEEGNAVRLGPDADFSCFGKALIARLNDFLPVECHDKFAVFEIHAQ